jgi:hypothetical protein
MPDQPSDPSDTSDPSGHEPSQKPPLADTIRAKLEEYDVDRHLNEFASTVEGAVRQGVTRAGELVHEHKGDIDRLLDKAAAVVDRHTEGKHADRISQVRGSLDRGVERIADQRDGSAPEEAPDDGPATDVPPSNR